MISGEAARLRDQLTRLRRLHEAALAIAAPVPPDAEAKARLLGDIATRAVEALDALSGRLVVAHDEPWRDLVPGTTSDDGHVTVRQTGTVGREVLRAGGDTLHVLGTGEPVVVPDVAAPHRFGPFPAALARGVRSFAIYPLISGGAVLGTLTLDFDRTGGLASDLGDLLELFAAHAAAALDRVRLLYLQQAHAAEQLARLEAEAAVRAREEFLSIAAHELRTPITTLRGTVQHLLRQLTRESSTGAVDPVFLERGLRRIDERSDKLVRLMSQLLDATRLQSGRLSLDRRPTDLVALAAGVIEASRATSSEHEFELRAPATLVAAVDPLRVEQVLTNLIDNAVRYSPAGTTIRLAVGQTKTGRARLAVRDNGPGIPGAHRERVFDRFYQVPLAGASAGMGLGLYVARQIVELHGGRIRVGAPKGGGARFVFTLPLSAPD